jgi:signal transduction histidine kinase
MIRTARLDTAYVVAAVVMAGAALFEAGYGGPEAELTPLSVGSALLTGLAVLVARWTPLGAIVLLAAVVAVPALVVPDLPPSGGAQLIVWMLLVGNAAYRLPRDRGLVGYGVAAVVPAVTIVVAGESVWEFLFYGLILAPAWIVGVLLRREQRRSAELAALAGELRREREKQAEVAVAAERTRISRELHDAVAHTVSVMTLQVGVVRRRLGVGSVEEETLRGAETLGRQAVDELRRIVGLVREGESAALAPLPSMAQLDELVAHVRGTGTSVTVDLTGPVAEIPQAVDMSAYRIVQEGLTNALRHAPGARIEVRVAVGAREIEVSVVNGPARTPVAASVGGGHGLVGIRERVHVLGGAFTAGATPDGGHRLHARLPLTSTTVGAS